MRTFLLAEHGIDLGAHVSDERLAEANRGVVALNRILNERDVDVGCLAQPLLRPRQKKYRYSAPFELMVRWMIIRRLMPSRWQRPQKSGPLR